MKFSSEKVVDVTRRMPLMHTTPKTAWRSSEKLNTSPSHHAKNGKSLLSRT
nr:MAG TPA: hypothetical protein [Caudoviricetes sp.]